MVTAQGTVSTPNTHFELGAALAVNRIDESGSGRPRRLLICTAVAGVDREEGLA